ncbi:hypothetical protein GDO81_012611 [Engystomops pustulosus]|uniref:Uncharacterized protein n=1 Tax=Engystomops pustulosus TaxID=76066 RepID=A0AAV7AUH2_ENGPU|nr:hypothetical protein GDO81_012611 [Engystomops pustulosus]
MIPLQAPGAAIVHHCLQDTAQGCDVLVPSLRLNRFVWLGDGSTCVLHRCRGSEGARGDLHMCVYGAGCMHCTADRQTDAIGSSPGWRE